MLRGGVRLLSPQRVALFLQCALSMLCFGQRMSHLGEGMHVRVPQRLHVSQLVLGCSDICDEGIDSCIPLFQLRSQHVALLLEVVNGLQKPIDGGTIVAGGR